MPKHKQTQSPKVPNYLLYTRALFKRYNIIYVENYNHPFSVLLIEDNPADVELTKEAFSHCLAEISVQVMTNGIDALTFLRDDRHALPDLILLDLNLPGWNGISFLGEIKSDSRLKKIPVIVLSTSNAGKDVMESYDLHANCYIVKPLDIDLFFEKVKNIEVFWLNTVLLPNTA